MNEYKHQFPNLDESGVISSQMYGIKADVDFIQRKVNRNLVLFIFLNFTLLSFAFSKDPSYYCNQQNICILNNLLPMHSKCNQTLMANLCKHDGVCLHTFTVSFLHRHIYIYMLNFAI